LSGGKGTRLRPITYTRAKQLVPVGNKPILFYGLEAIAEAGITEVGIVVGETKREIEKAAGDGSRFGLSISYIEQNVPLGLAHAVKVSKEFLGTEPFVMFLGDNLIKSGISDFVDRFDREKPNCQILLARVDNPSQFGVAELDGGKVVRLEEKPKEPRSDLALVGVYMFDETVFEAVENIRPSWRNELEITDAIQYLIDKGYDVRSHVITGWWKDTGKLEDILEANRMVLLDLKRSIAGEVDESSKLEGEVVIGKGSSVTSSTIRGPVVVGENCRVDGCYIGPFSSIADRVHIAHSEIEHSIILEGSEILNVDARIESSLVGRECRISRSPAHPRAYRFVIGERSSVEVL